MSNTQICLISRVRWSVFMVQRFKLRWSDSPPPHHPSPQPPQKTTTTTKTMQRFDKNDLKMNSLDLEKSKQIPAEANNGLLWDRRVWLWPLEMHCLLFCLYFVQRFASVSWFEQCLAKTKSQDLILVMVTVTCQFIDFTATCQGSVGSFSHLSRFSWWLQPLVKVQLIVTATCQGSVDSYGHLSKVQLIVTATCQGSVDSYDHLSRFSW